MDCVTVEKLLHSIAAQELDLPQDELVAYHLKHCQSCHDNFAASKHYFNVIEHMAVPDLNPDRIDRLFRSTRAMQPKSSHTSTNAVGPWFSQGLNQGLVFACALGLILMLGMFNRPSLNTGESLVGAAQVLASTNISLVIEVPSDMLQADLTLQFPDQLRWDGFEELQRIEWAVDLEQGVNILELPVTLVSRLVDDQPLIITASLEYQQEVRNFELPVQISDEVNVDNNDIRQILI